jgi:hypothetical protein
MGIYVGHDREDPKNALDRFDGSRFSRNTTIEEGNARTLQCAELMERYEALQERATTEVSPERSVQAYADLKDVVTQIEELWSEAIPPVSERPIRFRTPADLEHLVEGEQVIFLGFDNDDFIRRHVDKIYATFKSLDLDIGKSYPTILINKDGESPGITIWTSNGESPWLPWIYFGVPETQLLAHGPILESGDCAI